MGSHRTSMSRHSKPWKWFETTCHPNWRICTRYRNRRGGNKLKTRKKKTDRWAFNKTSLCMKHSWQNLVFRFPLSDRNTIKSTAIYFSFIWKQNFCFHKRKNGVVVLMATALHGCDYNLPLFYCCMSKMTCKVKGVFSNLQHVISA